MELYPILLFLIYICFNFESYCDHFISYSYKTFDTYYMNKNLLFINGEITEDLINNGMKKLKRFDKRKDIYIIIDSNGGSFLYGALFINEMMKYNVTCIALKAESISFDIFQICNKRYITQKTELFQHQLQVNFKGSMNEFEELIKEIDKIKFINRYIEKTTLKKTNLTRVQYENLIRNDWKLSGYREIMKYNLADEVVNYKN